MGLFASKHRPLPLMSMPEIIQSGYICANGYVYDPKETPERHPDVSGSVGSYDYSMHTAYGKSRWKQACVGRYQT